VLLDRHTAVTGAPGDTLPAGLTANQGCQPWLAIT
jgi:hypothetical protein